MSTPKPPQPPPLVLDRPVPNTWAEGDAGGMSVTLQGLNPPGEVLGPAQTRSRHRKLDTGGWEVELRGSGAPGTGCILIPFAVFWNGMVLLFAVGMLKDGPDPKLTTGGWIAMAGFVGVFGAVGILLASMAVATRGRKGSVTCDAGMVRIMERGFLRSRRVELPLGEIESVVAEPTGWKVNEVALVRLVVRMKGGERRRFFMGHAIGDVVWVAGLLRQSLPLGAAPSARVRTQGNG